MILLCLSCLCETQGMDERTNYGSFGRSFEYRRCRATFFNSMSKRDTIDVILPTKIQGHFIIFQIHHGESMMTKKTVEKNNFFRKFHVFFNGRET